MNDNNKTKATEDTITVEETLAFCESVAHEHTRATQLGEFAEGYRCAANDIARVISRRRSGRRPTELELELREVEVEARTLARVVATATGVVEHIGGETAEANGIRRLLRAFFHDNDLPIILRLERRSELESTTTMIAPLPKVATTTAASGSMEVAPAPKSAPPPPDTTTRLVASLEDGSSAIAKNRRSRAAG